MSNSLKKRITRALLVGGVCFMIICNMYKLFNYREDWFSVSLMWAISWSIAYFVSRTIAEAATIVEAAKGKKMISIIILEAVILFFVALVVTFITGVIIGLSNWDYVVSNTCFPFALSLLVHNEWIRD